jgi:hypothetical protein
MIAVLPPTVTIAESGTQAKEVLSKAGPGAFHLILTVWPYSVHPCSGCTRLAILSCIALCSNASQVARHQPRAT